MNYLYLPGVSGNYASTPDNAGISVTGDIDMRVYCALDRIPPLTDQNIIGKRSGAGQISYELLIVATTGFLNMKFSVDGSTAIGAGSNVAPPVQNGAPIWLRITRVAASGVVTFYTSMDGVTWSTLGSPVTTTTGNIFDSTAPLEIGSELVGTARLTAGKIFYVEIRNGINGTVVANPDFRGYVSNGMTDAAGNVWTVNSSGVPPAQIVQRSPANHLWLPGKSGNYTSTPDAAALDVTGDIDLRAYISPDTVRPAVKIAILGKWNSATNNRSYNMFIEATGAATFQFSTDGTSGTIQTASTANAVRFSPGTPFWLRSTFVASTGAWVIYTSTDGTTWATLGSGTLSGAPFTIFSGASVLELGSIGVSTGNFFPGKIFYVEVRNGINGTVVASFRPTAAYSSGTNPTTISNTQNLLDLDTSNLEGSIGGWVQGGGTTPTLTRDTSTSAEGSACLKVVSSGAGTMTYRTGSIAANNFAIGVNPSTAYSYLCTVKGAITGTMSINISWYDSAGTFISNSTTNYTPTASFVDQVVQATSPSTAASAAVGAAWTAGASNETIYVDKHAFFAGTVAAGNYTAGGIPWLTRTSGSPAAQLVQRTAS